MNGEIASAQLDLRSAFRNPRLDNLNHSVEEKIGKSSYLKKVIGFEVGAFLPTATGVDHEV